ncbi:hypothetical protein AJ79_01374 [Helicocarpus griseus UAMH5409]|uniref:C6 finger domain transcription factor nscR n=1 Tax=Helicocarpus griseus UAMH5409 TaxID=1447875 RepID=A0A2B7Y708_9EURO|nr:hypothetical protein AJ79_01374 [Helicocarpus griseus UAMH5409]
MSPRIVASGHSCFECRRRKIKCDRSLPCSYCTRTKIKCAYPAPKTQVAEKSNYAVGDGIVHRVERIESILVSLENGLSQVKNVLERLPESSLRRSHGLQGLKDDDEHPSSIDLDNGLSSRSSPPQESQPNPLRSSRAGEQLSQQLLFKHSPSLPLKSPHLPPAMISSLWQRYLEVVDPVLKIFHAPTVQKLVMSLICGQARLDSSATCLIFAIYYSTVVTMSDSECQQMLSEEKGMLLKRYRTGLETAFTKANIYRSTDIAVLQAFVLYIICGRLDRQGPDACSLIGVITGNAMRIGLHCDGESAGISPFDVEMRRRLWWHIYTLDVRIAEDYASDPCLIESSFNTKLPLNINDASLHPDMSEPPQSQPGRTEMLLSLVMFEVTAFSRRIMFSDKFCRTNSYAILSPAQKLKAVDLLRGRIEKQYLSHCDKKIPFDFITATAGRLIFAKLKIAAVKPKSNQDRRVPMSVSNRNSCIQLLQHAHVLRQYEKGKQWLWPFQTCVEWDALAYLLLDLCVYPSGSEKGVAWKAVDETFHHWADHPDVRHDSRWKHIEELRSQALGVRDTTHGQLPGADLAQKKNNSSSHQLRAAYEGPPLSTLTEVPRNLDLASAAETDERQAQTFLPAAATEDPGSGQITHMQTLADAAAAMAEPNIASGEDETMSNAADMPGTGTVCEWSAGLFERYFEVVDHRQTPLTSLDSSAILR